MSYPNVRSSNCGTLTGMEHAGYCRDQRSGRRGLTLIEILIFSSLFALAGIIFTNVLIIVTRLQARQSAVAQVNQETQFLLQTIQALVADAVLIDMTRDSATSTLRLRTVAATDPTLVFASGTAVYIRQGSGGSAPTQLISERVSVSSLQFTRRVNAGAHDTLDVSFILAYETNNPYREYEQRIRVSAARSAAAVFDSDIRASSTGAYRIGTSTAAWASINDTMFFNASGNVALASVFIEPRERLEINEGDVYIASSSRGLILRDAGGFCQRHQVATDGSITKTGITCP